MSRWELLFNLLAYLLLAATVIGCTAFLYAVVRGYYDSE